MSKKYTMKQFSAALKKMSSEVRQRVLEEAGLAGGFVIEGIAKQNVKERLKKHETGNLANSIQTDVKESSGDRVVVTVGTGVIYAKIQEFGGTVKPVHAKKLHWVDENGKHHIANQVTLPARPYLGPAVKQNPQTILSAVSAVLQKEIEGSI